MIYIFSTLAQKNRSLERPVPSLATRARARHRLGSRTLERGAAGAVGPLGPGVDAGEGGARPAGSATVLQGFIWDPN